VNEKQLNATNRSIILVDGAVKMVQDVEVTSNKDMRIISTTWLDNDGNVLRQDQTVLVDKMPAISAESKL